MFHAERKISSVVHSASLRASRNVRARRNSRRVLSAVFNRESSVLRSGRATWASVERYVQVSFGYAQPRCGSARGDFGAKRSAADNVRDNEEKNRRLCTGRNRRLDLVYGAPSQGCHPVRL